MTELDIIFEFVAAPFGIFFRNIVRMFRIKCNAYKIFSVRFSWAIVITWPTRYHTIQPVSFGLNWNARGKKRRWILFTEYTQSTEFRLTRMLVNNNRIQSLTDLIALPVFRMLHFEFVYEWPHASWCYDSNTFSSSIAYSMSKRKKNRTCGYPNRELCKQVLTIEIICRLLFMPPSHNGLKKSLFFLFCYFKSIKWSRILIDIFVEVKNLQQTPFTRIEC